MASSTIDDNIIYSRDDLRSRSSSISTQQTRNNLNTNHTSLSRRRTPMIDDDSILTNNTNVDDERRRTMIEYRPTQTVTPIVIERNMTVNPRQQSTFAKSSHRYSDREYFHWNDVSSASTQPTNLDNNDHCELCELNRHYHHTSSMNGRTAECACVERFVRKHNNKH